jgi:quercetin dioxygenase-like cupin family protein
MRIRNIALLVATVAIPAFVACSGHSGASTLSAPEQTINWGPAPAVFPAGAEFAVLQGDPGSNAPFTIRLRLPDGYRIAPHTHPTDENVTVISGNFQVGMGTAFRTDSMLTLPPGSFVTAPAGHAHFAQARGGTVVQVTAVGPFALTYVNPADLPRAASR